MHFKNIREFITLLEDRGELRRISTPVSADLEITEVTDRVSKRGGPALLFENVEGFDIPVLINTYGSSERIAWALGAEHLDELPERVRKPGTVGIPTGLEISIIDETGRHVTPGSIGEVVIRGPSVTAGYQNNPDANAKAFRDGWFLTGDQGVIDPDGYLRLTGRLKEIINRGGEKISPLEVDEVLTAHPAVAQALTFAVPHPKLGEEVAAADRKSVV